MKTEQDILLSLSGKRWILKNEDMSGSLMERIMKGRDLSAPEEYHDPFLMKDMSKAVERVRRAIEKNERVVVYGDYDMDGVSGTAILVKTLEYLGAGVSYRIPHRFDDGYGLHDKYVDECLAAGASLLITVDCGISCEPQITRAVSLGLDIIVTDHHTIPENLPRAATAILHPLQSDCNYPCKGLTGSAVAFKFAHALLVTLAPSQSSPIAFLETLVDLAAFGVIADMGPLTDENRLIVQRGLQQCARTNHVGLTHLKKLARINDDEIDTQTVGFRIAPRINAAGRMSHPYHALQLFLETDNIRAKSRAEHLELLNVQRQEMTKIAFKEVLATYEPRTHRSIFIASSPRWHTGILGLLAAKIVETFGIPAIVLQDRDDFCVASARSIEGINITDLIATQKQNLMSFGGHAQAAGFAVSKEKYDTVTGAWYERIELLRAAAAQTSTVASATSPSAPLAVTHAPSFAPTLNLDTEIHPHELTEKNAYEIESLRPFGIANEKPLFFLKNAEITRITPIGKDQNHARLMIRIPDAPKSISQNLTSPNATPRNSTQELQGIFFNAPTELLRTTTSTISTTSSSASLFSPPVSLACHLDLNRFNGRTTLQLQVVDVLK